MKRLHSTIIFSFLFCGLLPLKSHSNEAFNCDHAQLYAAAAMAMRANGLDYNSALNQLTKDPSLNPNSENSLVAQEIVRMTITNALDEAYAVPSFLVKNLITLDEKEKFALAFAEEQNKACNQELSGMIDMASGNTGKRCSLHKSIARVFMAARQESVPIDQMSNLLSDKNLQKFHIETVYKKPLESDASKKASAIDVYGNEIYIHCMNANGAEETRQ